MHRPATFMSSSKTPACAQVRNQRWAVLLEPSLLGRSFHLAPLSKTQKIACNIKRLSAGGLPPLGLRGASGTLSHNQSNSDSFSIGMTSFATVITYLASRFWDRFYCGGCCEDDHAFLQFT